MDKWNRQASPNNNGKSSDMDWSFKGSSKTTPGKISEKELNNKKIENELKEQNF